MPSGEHLPQSFVNTVHDVVVRYYENAGGAVARVSVP